MKLSINLFVKQLGGTLALLCVATLGICQPVQVRQRCGTVEAMAALRAENPELESESDFEKRISKAIAQEKIDQEKIDQEKIDQEKIDQEKIDQGKIDQEKVAHSAGRTTDDVLTIPVVVHIIHRGQAVGAGDNLPDAQVFSQIKCLNDDFRRRAGTRGFNTDPRGADTRIEFVLAKRTPAGLATNGINRVSATSLGITSTTFTTAQLNGTIKPRTVWDATRYLNIWVANVNGVYGIAQFPLNSSLSGIACTPSTNAANTDGVTISPVAFGSKDDGPWLNIDNGTKYGRTTPHEVGHWLGLRHIWGDATCGTDYCEDTPVHRSRNDLTCPTHPKPNTCGTADEMFENYMDYTTDSCMNIFTRDQMIRMRAVLKTSPRRKELLNSLALVPPVATDIGLIEILSPAGDLCTPGSTTAQVVVKNWGTDTLISLSISYKIGTNNPVTLLALLYLAPAASETITINGLILPLGTNTLRFYTSEPNGQTDGNTAQDTLQTTLKVNAGQELPYSEFFEGVNTPPQWWQVRNPGLDCKQWRMQSVPTGPSGGATVGFAFGFYQNTAAVSQRDELITPLLNLAADTSAYLYFDVAHARSGTGTFGSLLVEISTDCGTTWSPNPVYAKFGAALATVAISQSSEFFPSSTAQWRTEKVNLGAYTGKSVRLRFVAVNAGGNNLFIDNVTLLRALPKAPEVLAIVPDSGTYLDTVLVKGTGFSSARSVSFGSRISPKYWVLSDTTLEALVPAGAVSAPVSVTNVAGTSASATVFRVLAPTSVLSFTPTSGQAGSVVTLKGTNFSRLQKLSLGLVPITTYTVLSDTSLLATLPAGSKTGAFQAFSTLDSATSAGFFIVGTVLTMRTGQDVSCAATLITPGYPGNYPNSVSYTYTLRAPAGQQIILSFLSFATEAIYDLVSVYNGAGITSPVLLNAKSGTLSPLPTFTSTNGALTVRFVSDISNVAQGLCATVACTPPPPPKITGFTPRQGPVGYTFGLVGTNLDKVDSVWIGRTLVAGYSKSATAITGLVPAGAVTGKVRVSGVTGSDSTLLPYIVTPGLAYCRPTYTACAGTGLTRIRQAGGGLQVSTLCADASGAAFTIYPAQDSTTGQLKAGGLASFDIWATGTGQQIGAWVDANRNGIFEAAEYFAATRQPTSAQPGVLVISLPSTVDTGAIGVRIRSKVAITAAQACSPATAGSGAEFTLRVVPCGVVSVARSVSTDTACLGDTLTLRAQGAGLPAWFATATTSALQDTGATVRFVPAASGALFVAMIQENCYSPRTEVVYVVNSLPQAGFTIAGNQLSVAQTSQGPGLEYQWYLDGQPLPAATGLQVDIATTGTYTLRVTNAAGCTALSPGQQVIFTQTRTALTKASLFARPNPSTGVFILKAPSPLPAIVTDMLGRVIWQGELQTTQVLDISKAGAGIYSLKAQGLPALRLVVE